MLGITATLAGCSTPPTINMFEAVDAQGGDFIFTRPPDAVAGRATVMNGVWLSQDAVTRLQKHDVLYGKIK